MVMSLSAHWWFQQKALTVDNGNTIAVTKVDNTGDDSRLVIEDGGQLICNNPVHATVKKSVAHGGGAKYADNWYTIASPINNPTFDKVTNLIQSSTDNYDLYRYNETSMIWENQKNTTDHADFTTLENGRGYLYWNNTGAELSFAGQVNASNVIYHLTYGATNDAIKGFNLIGNPFPHNIYKGTGGAISDSRLAAGFYVLNNASGWSAKLDYTTPIVPGQGILVETTEAFDLTITNTNAASTADTKGSSNDLITFNVANDKYEDVVYIQFKDATNLNKIEHLNTEIPMLYVHQNDADYAIANMDRDVASFDLNFVAATAGTYTISAKAEGEFEYFHLIDRIAGKDIDMLNEGEYTFTANPNDYEYRFVVKLSEEGDDDTNIGNYFAFISNGEIIINGTGTLQVIDMLGRVMLTQDCSSLNSKLSTLNYTPGVYVLRLITNGETKTQKIVKE